MPLERDSFKVIFFITLGQFRQGSTYIGRVTQGRWTWLNDYDLFVFLCQQRVP